MHSNNNNREDGDDKEENSYDFKSDPDVAPLLRLFSSSNGKLPNYFHSMSKRCMPAMDHLMSYNEIFGQEVSDMTIRSHLLVFYYCMSEPLIGDDLRAEIRNCLSNEKHATEILPCTREIMKAKKIADRVINYGAQLEDEAQQKRGEGSFFSSLNQVQSKCLPFLMKEKYCNKFLEQCEKDMLQVTPSMFRKCQDMERQGLECVQSAFCKRQQERYLTCMDRAGGDDGDCIKEKQQLTMCGETYQSVARTLTVKQILDKISTQQQEQEQQEQQEQ